MRLVLIIFILTALAVAYATFDSAQVEMAPDSYGLSSDSTEGELRSSPPVTKQEVEVASIQVEADRQALLRGPTLSQGVEYGPTVNVGEYMDADDPSTWPSSGQSEPVNFGEYMDADDPSTWPQAEVKEALNVGELMDADNPTVRPQRDSIGSSNSGDFMDPDDSSTWPRSESSKVVNTGEFMDPDDSSTWPQ